MIRGDRAPRDESGIGRRSGSGAIRRVPPRMGETSQPAGTRDDAPARRTRRRSPARRGQVPPPPCRGASRPARRQATTLPPATKAAPLARRRILPYPYPSRTRDRRSWAILRPVDTPKCGCNARKRPLSPWQRRPPNCVTWLAPRRENLVPALQQVAHTASRTTWLPRYEGARSRFPGPLVRRWSIGFLPRRSGSKPLNDPSWRLSAPLRRWP